MKPDTSSPKRSFAKAVSWETFSNLVCFGIAYTTFGNLGGCAVFTLVCFIVKLILFYYHERIWHRIRWGKNHE
jgi:uncharacterized membrane protein